MQLNIANQTVENFYKVKFFNKKLIKLSLNKEHLSDAEKLTSPQQKHQNLGEQSIIFTPVYYIAGTNGYVAAPSAGFTVPQQSGLQQPQPPSAVSTSVVHTEPPPSLQVVHGLPTTVSSSTPGQQSDIYKTMQPQSAQNMFVPQNVANNTSGNVRTNQPAAGAIYRQQTPSPTPRNRYVQPTAMYPPVHQSVVVQQFAPPYATRQPQFQQFQYSHQYFPNSYYSYYVPQPPQHQRSAVNPGVGVGLSSAMTVQPGGSVSGPATAGNPAQLPLGVPPTSNVLSVGNTSSVQPVGVSPHVGMSHQPPQQQPHIKGKLRTHALQIIHPITNRNILEDLDNEKNNTSTPRALPAATTAPVETVDYQVLGSLSAQTILNQCDTLTSIEASQQKDNEAPPNRCNSSTNVHPEPQSYNKDISHQTQQTPIVSAMSDAPSVEILPTQPHKSRSKKSQNVSSSIQDQNSSQGKSGGDDIKQQTDVSPIATTTNYNCVHESLPTSYINQQVPQQQEQLKDKLQNQVEKISTSLTETTSLKSSSDIKNSNQQSSNESCTEYSVASSKHQEKQSNIINITESVKTMQLEEIETLTLPQQKQTNIVSNKQEQEQETQQECSNETNGNESISTIINASITDVINTDVTNNNVAKITCLSTNTKINKSIDKFDKENENISDKKTTTSTSKETVVDDASSISKSVDDRNETDPAINCPKADLECYSASDSKTTITDNKNETKTVHSESLAADKCINDGNDILSNAATVTTETTTNDESENKPSVENLINYNEGQWSPSNPCGKKQYDREQLMQLRDAKASRKQPEVKNTLIFSQTNLMPSFASLGNVKKIPSLVGGARGSGDGYQNNFIKQSSMSGRTGGGADGGHHNRSSGKPIIHLNLSLNQDVKLNEADNAWRPSVLGKGDGLSDPELKARDKDELIRRIRGILNKLTPEKFETLVEEIIKLKIDTPEKMEAVMILVFEKAIDEPNFSVSYASLCHRLINEVKARDERMEIGTKSNLAQFRSALLDKTEREFTENVTKSSAKDEKLKPIRENISMCTDGNEKVELEALLEEEERKIRRRSGGTVRFIGELFKISILTGKIIHTCIEALLKDPNNEDMLECLCKLLTTVGQKFEQTPMPKSDKIFFSLDSVIQRMQNIASKSENTKISSRVRFMLQDVIDLRKKKWKTTRNEAPKTMEQIEKEANNEQLSNQYLNNMYQVNLMSGSGGSSSGKRDDRVGRNDGRSGNYGGSHSQRGETGSLKRQQGGGIGSGGSHSQSSNSNNDDNWHTIPTNKGNRSVVVDTNKLVGMTNVDMNIKKMGGASLFQWSNSSTQPTATLSNSFAVLSLDSNKNSSSDRDRSGPRNKGSYNKGSMERDRYDRGDRMLSRTSSSQASRENSSSRGSQGVRGMGNSSNMQKSASHSKYTTQQMTSSLSRMTVKPSMSSSSSTSGLYREPNLFASNNLHQQFNPAISDPIKPSAASPAVFEEPTDTDLKLIKAVTTEMVENVAISKNIDISTVSCIKRIKDSQRCGLLYYILTDYLHLVNVGYMHRRNLANCVAFLIENKYISVEHFQLAYKNFADIASDLIVDIPELWLYIFEFTRPLIVRKIITVNDLWNSQLRNSGPSSFSLNFLKTFLQYCTREVGPSFTRTMWKKNHVKWTDFMNENEVAAFIQINKFEYIEDENSQPEIDTRQPKENRIKHVVEHIEQLLEENSNVDNIIDYINGNIIDVDKTFIKSLTTTLTSFAIKDSSNYNLDISCFQKICIPVLLRYLDSKEELELECLYAIQLLVHSLEHPRGLLGAIFGAIYDADVIPQETFIVWRSSKDQSAGKGVAVKALNPFFDQVINGETSDDN